MTKVNRVNIKIFNDNSEFIHAITKIIESRANDSIKHRKIFNIVLCGGDTPIDIYKNLENLNTDWNSWNVWVSDERIGNYEETNVKMIVDNFPHFQNFSKDQFHFVKSNLGLESAAHDYMQELKNTGVFDLVLLGLGTDGHTASLFPGNDWGLTDDSPAVIPVYNSPKSPATRVSLSANRLKKSIEIVYICRGTAKRTIVDNIIQNCCLPVSAITALDRTSLYYCRQD